MAPPSYDFELMKSLKLSALDMIGGIFCHICQTTFRTKKVFDTHYLEHQTGSDIIYTCISCRTEIPRYRIFQDHCYRHVCHSKFKCIHCNKTFLKQCLLKQHVEKMHKIKCGIASCNKEFPTEKEMHLHQIVHKNNSKPPYQCYHCKQKINILDDCEFHIDKHAQFNYTCPICNEEVTKTTAYQHITQHFNEEIKEADVENEQQEMNEESAIDTIGGILCCFCDNMYKNRSEFDSHFLAEHDSKDLVYSCIACKKTYAKYSAFGSHCYYHIACHKFRCDVCGRGYPRLSLLIKHTEFHCEGEKKKKLYRCIVCDHEFKTQNQLNDHLRTEHRNKEIACPEAGCGSVFETCNDLRLHRKQHKTQLSNWCQQCGLTFHTLASCEKHIDIHRMKTFSCPICKRTYREKYQLMKHVPTHFETVLHMCMICGKIYNAKNRLFEHSKTHAPVKSYECTYCGKGFNKTSQLQHHITTHTGARPYKCVACPKTFASYPNWNKHLKKMHMIDAKTLDRPKIDGEGIKKLKATKRQTDVASNSEGSADAESVDSETMEWEQVTTSGTEKDINELIKDLLPLENVTFLTDSVSSIGQSQPLAPYIAEEVALSIDESHLLVQTSTLPLGYGPSCAGDDGLGPTLIDLDDVHLPHVDPKLTIRKVHSMPTNKNHQYEYGAYDTDIAAGKTKSNWDQPAVLSKITKYNGEY